MDAQRVLAFLSILVLLVVLLSFSGLLSSDNNQTELAPSNNAPLPESICDSYNLFVGIACYDQANQELNLEIENRGSNAISNLKFEATGTNSQQISQVSYLLGPDEKLVNKLPYDLAANGPIQSIQILPGYAASQGQTYCNSGVTVETVTNC